MTNYKSRMLINEKYQWVIIDECRKIINDNPSRQELIDLKQERKYNENNTCDRCEKGILTPGKAYREYKKGIWTGKWICKKCNRKEYSIPSNNNRYDYYPYSKEELLEILRQFWKENGRLPVYKEFENNPKYPCSNRYVKYFGSWNNAIIQSGLWDKRYNDTNTCDRCGINFDDMVQKYPLKEHDEKGNDADKWVCHICHRKYDSTSIENIRKRLTDSRTHNLDPNSPKGKGDKGQKLLCEWKGFNDLNKENDNYCTPIDCIDKDTALYYQVKISYYNPIDRCWTQNFENEHTSIAKGFCFRSLFLFCISKDGDIVKRVYEIPEEEIIKRKSVVIYKNPTDSQGNPKISWYDKYRIKESELKKINDIWQKINK